MNRRYALSLLAAALVPDLAAAADDADWPSYNRTLASDRYSPLADIDRGNVAKLDVACTYDVGEQTSFQTGPIVVAGTLYASTEFDVFALDAATCKLLWRTHENYKPAGPLKVNRGVAFLNGKLFRGTQDGRVLAYDAKDGRKVWDTRIADPAKGETVPAAPIAHDGLVYVGNAGGDNYGVKGRMYALDAASGKIVWEFFLVPRGDDAPKVASIAADPVPAKTWGNAGDVPITGGTTWTSYSLDADAGLLYVPGGNPAPDFVPSLRPGDNLYADSVVVLDAKSGAYKSHYQLVRGDFHDWDASTAPALFTSHAGRKMLAIAPKDGHLYGYDLGAGKRVYATPTTTIKNATAALTKAGTHFCPGTQGGSEWNGAAFDPSTNLVYVGAVDWCSTVRVADPAKAKNASAGQPWSGSDDEKNVFGTMDPAGQWAGWVTAVDADSGKTKWKHKAKAPVMSGVTPTAGGIVLFGDMGGHFAALDAASGAELWSRDLAGAVGGGVVTYRAGGRQFVAVADGMTSPIWPTAKVDASIVVFALPK